MIYVALIESLDQPPLILGHSLGCLVAQMVAEKTEVAGMILMGPAPTADILPLSNHVSLFWQTLFTLGILEKSHASV